MNAIPLIDEKLADIQAQIDLCVAAIQLFSTMKRNGEQGAAEELKEQGVALMCYQAQRGILQQLREELVGDEAEPTPTKE